MSPASGLAGVPLFAGVSEPGLRSLEADAVTRRLLAGELLVVQGDAGDDLYVVLRGRVRVTVSDEHGERDVNELGPGAAVGELALLTGEARAATVRAIRDTTVLVLPGSTFRRHFEEEPALAAAVARELARRVQLSGGMPIPPPRPALIAVRGSRGDEPVRDLAGSLEAALAPFGPVVTLTEGSAEGVDRVEAEHAHVVLADTGEDDAWSALCARQADRMLVVAASGAPPDRIAAGSDLVLLGPHDGAALRALLDATRPRAHYRLASTLPVDPGIGRLARRLVGRSLGLVFSGGGARGLAHVGVLQVLEEEGIVVDRFAGCSMGAFIAGMAAAGWSGADIYDRCNEELVRRSPFNDYTVPRVALLRSRKAARMFDRLFHDLTIEELPKPLVTVSADLLSSSIVEHRSGSLIEAVGASMSIPGLAPPLARSGRLLVDGGVLNNLPVDVLAGTGEGPIVAVDVLRQLVAGDETEPALPSITETLSRATVLGSTERAERNRALALLVIAPAAQSMQLREFKALDRAVEAGRAAARRALDAGGREAIERAVTAPVETGRPAPRAPVVAAPAG